jgi:hypothetical protein
MMATKKQKREDAEVKHAAFMEEQRLSGLRAQQADRAARERRHQSTQKVVDEINENYNKVLSQNFIEISRAYGSEVQELEAEGLISKRTEKRADWLSFLHSLPENKKRAAVDTYYEQYCKNLKGEEKKRVSLTGRRLDLEAKSTATPPMGKDPIFVKSQSHLDDITVGEFNKLMDEQVAQFMPGLTGHMGGFVDETALSVIGETGIPVKDVKLTTGFDPFSVD